MLSIYRTQQEWVSPPPMCGLKGSALNLSSSCQHILILLCCWLLVAVVLLPYTRLLLHCDLTLRVHLRGLQSIPGSASSQSYSVLCMSHCDLKENFNFFPVCLGNCKQLSTQRNSAETCKYCCKLEGWIFFVFLVASWLFKKDGQLYTTMQCCIPESSGDVPKSGTDFIQFT